MPGQRIPLAALLIFAQFSHAGLQNLVNGGTHSERMKIDLLDIADKLEAAQNDQVSDNKKATVLSLGKVVVRAALLPDWTVDEFDSKLIGSILQRAALLQ